MPIDYSQYPDNWKAISIEVRTRAEWRCEGSPDYPECRAENHKPHPVTGSKVVLTVAHLDHDKQNSDRDNLRAWCQRCHLNYDLDRHIANRKRNRAMKELREQTDAGQLRLDL